MQFKIQEGPEQGLQLVERNVPLYLDVVDGGTPAFEVAVPHPIYTVPTDAFLRGALLASARLTAWQYVITVEEEPFGVAEVAWNEEKGLATYASTSLRLFAEAIINAIARAENLPEVQNREYELRMLRAPGMYLFAVWLTATTKLLEDNDLLIPIEPVPLTLVQAQVLSDANLAINEKALTTILQSLARTRMDTSDSE